MYPSGILQTVRSFAIADRSPPFGQSTRATPNLGSSPKFDMVRSVPACHFCRRSAEDLFALTTCTPGDDWARVVEPACARCLALLRRSGPDGLRLKSSGERWYLGHERGLFAAPHQR